MRRIALVFLLLLVAATVTVSPVFTQLAAAESPSDVAADFNNDGFPDLAVGAPGENDIAGVVNVLYGASGGLNSSGAQVFGQVGGPSGFLDRFGSALAAGDFNNDDFADLAAGAPSEAVGDLGQAGAVSVLPGSPDGLTATGGRLFTQVGGAVEGGDLFGQALAVGDFNNNGFMDLAAGAPTENVGAATNAGAVSVLNGSAGGLTATGGRLFTQSGTGRVETDDQFGSQLAAGDFNDNGFADLAAAAPTEDIGTVNAAGAVSVLQGSGGGLTTTGGQLWTQNTAGVPGIAETFDLFGGIEIFL